MSYNARIILNEILTSSTYYLTMNNYGLFKSSDEWSEQKKTIESLPEICQMIYLEGWIKRREDEINEEELKKHEGRKKKEREEREEKERKDRKEREEREENERESRVARQTLFAHYGPGLALAVPTPGYPGKHLVHIGGGTFIPGPAPVGFIAPGSAPVGFIASGPRLGFISPRPGPRLIGPGLEFISPRPGPGFIRGHRF